jgi:hypothetical protein
MAKYSGGRTASQSGEGSSQIKKVNLRKKFKDVNDVLENATDEEFRVIHARLGNENPASAGWLLLKRIESKDTLLFDLVIVLVLYWGLI